MAPRALVVRQLFFEIDLHGTLTVLAFAAIPLAVHKVAAIAVHFTYRGLQVMHIAFHLAINRIFSAVFTTAFLPALTLVAELPCGNNMFPLYAAGAVFIFAHPVPARLQIHDAFLPCQLILHPQ